MRPYNEGRVNIRSSDATLLPCLWPKDAGGASEAGISLPWEGASIAFVWTPASAAAHQMPMWGAAPHPVEQEEQ